MPQVRGEATAYYSQGGNRKVPRNSEGNGRAVRFAGVLEAKAHAHRARDKRSFPREGGKAILPRKLRMRNRQRSAEKSLFESASSLFLDGKEYFGDNSICAIESVLTSAVSGSKIKWLLQMRCEIALYDLIR